MYSTTADSICNKCKSKDTCKMCDLQSGLTAITSCYGFQAAKRTNGDSVRAMNDEQLEAWYWWMHEAMREYIDSVEFVHAWLKEEVNERGEYNG